MRIMCHCVIFVIIISLCGVLMYSDSHKDKDITIDYYPDSGLGEEFYSSGSSHIILDQPFKSVPVDEFENHLDKAKNVADLLRIFFEQKDLSDFDINTIMNMKSKHIYGTSHFERRNKPRSWMNDDEDAIEDRAAAFEHHLEMARSPLGTCRFPLPEIEYVHSVESDTFRHYYPRCTVVHRCRNYTGCCPNGEVCGPKKENGIRIFTKAFLVFETVQGQEGRVLPSGDHFVQTMSFINHTECECQRVHVTSNCHKKCPQQFTKRRHGIDCECACTHQARLCKFIHRGHLPLEEKDLECIKAGECIKPKCATGEFRIHTGFCPTKKHHRRKG